MHRLRGCMRPPRPSSRQARRPSEIASSIEIGSSTRGAAAPKRAQPAAASTRGYESQLSRRHRPPAALGGVD